MESLHALAAQLDEASATLTGIARAVTATDPAQAAFGAHGSGRPGEIGRALHRQWVAATDARAREASAVAARLAATASALRSAAARYADVDESAHHRLTATPEDPWSSAGARPPGGQPDATRGGFWPGPDAVHRSLGGHG